MALIKCKNCNHDISDKSKQCIHCGAPINYTSPKSNTKIILIALIPIIILVLGILAYKTLIPTKNNANYLGTWSHTVLWQEQNNTYKKTYAEFVLKKDHTFSYYGYDYNKKSDQERFEGTYTKEDNIITITYTKNNNKYTSYLYIKGNKLHAFTKNSKNYFLKGDNSEIVINYKKQYLDDYDYKRIINNNEDAIVIVYQDTCHYCKEYEETVREMYWRFDTPIYFYNIKENNTIEVRGTPTTIIIKNGGEIDRIVGKVSEDKLYNTIYENGIE